MVSRMNGSPARTANPVDKKVVRHAMVGRNQGAASREAVVPVGNLAAASLEQKAGSRVVSSQVVSKVRLASKRVASKARVIDSPVAKRVPMGNSPVERRARVAGRMKVARKAKAAKRAAKRVSRAVSPEAREERTTVLPGKKLAQSPTGNPTARAMVRLEQVKKERSRATGSQRPPVRSPALESRAPVVTSRRSNLVTPSRPAAVRRAMVRGEAEKVHHKPIALTSRVSGSSGKWNGETRIFHMPATPPTSPLSICRIQLQPERTTCLMHSVGLLIRLRPSSIAGRPCVGSPTVMTPGNVVSLSGRCVAWGSDPVVCAQVVTCLATYRGGRRKVAVVVPRANTASK